METHTLTAQQREEVGRKAQAIRDRKMIPGVLYGKGKDNMNLKIEGNAFRRVLKKAGENSLIELSIEGETKPRNVLAYDVQVHPVTDAILHVDFYEVQMDKEVTTEVPLEFIGESNAVKNLGGTLSTNKTEIEIRALPAHLPHSIQVDISALETFEDSLLIKDIKLPAHVELVSAPDETVATVTAPRSEEELKELDQKVEADVSQVADVEPLKDAEDGEKTEADDTAKADKKDDAS